MKITLRTMLPNINDGLRNLKNSLMKILQFHNCMVLIPIQYYYFNFKITKRICGKEKCLNTCCKLLCNIFIQKIKIHFTPCLEDI